MAIIHYEHFDLYGDDANAIAARGYTRSGGFTLPTDFARTGARCMRVQGGSGFKGLQWATPAPVAVLGTGFALRLDGTPADEFFRSQGVSFTSTGDPFWDGLRLMFNSQLGITAARGMTNLGSSAPAVITSGAWAWVEVKLTSGPGPTDGSIEVRVNGAPVLNLTGLNFTSQWTSVAIGLDDVNTTTYRFDDWIVWDNTDTVNNNFIGDTFVLVAPPSADGTPSNWATSSGSSRWSLVDEAVPDDADFILANTVGDVNEFTHAALNLPVGAVAAIAVQGRAYKTDAGSSSVELGIASGTQASMSPERALGTGPQVFTHIANRNPNGNLAWTQATAQAARVRVRRAA